MQQSSTYLTEAERLFYGQCLANLLAAIELVLAAISRLRETYRAQNARDPVLYTTSRIKTAASMQAKLRRLGQAPTVQNALSAAHDAAGVRAVCLFVEDVYRLAQDMASEQGIEVLQRKDYIAHPKPSGYRSYHLIVKQQVGAEWVPLEIQLRTVAMDTWAALEHEIHYKRDWPNQALICAELKRCADEIASTELSLETIREWMNEGGSENHADFISGR